MITILSKLEYAYTVKISIYLSLSHTHTKHQTRARTIYFFNGFVGAGVLHYLFTHGTRRSFLRVFTFNKRVSVIEFFLISILISNTMYLIVINKYLIIRLPLASRIRFEIKTINHLLQDIINKVVPFLKKKIYVKIL